MSNVKCLLEVGGGTTARSNGFFLLWLVEELFQLLGSVHVLGSLLADALLDTVILLIYPSSEPMCF